MNLYGLNSSLLSERKFCLVADLKCTHLNYKLENESSFNLKNEF